MECRSFLSRLVSLVIVGGWVFSRLTVFITSAYFRYLAADGTHLEEMSAVRERTGAPPQSHQGHGGAAFAEDPGGGREPQELEMVPEAEATADEPERQGYDPAGKEQRILHVHTFAPCSLANACAIGTSSSCVSAGTPSVHLRSRSRMRLRYSLLVMRPPMVVSWRMESTIVRKCSPPPRSMKGVRMRMALSDRVFNHRYPSRSGRVAMPARAMLRSSSGV